MTHEDGWQPIAGWGNRHEVSMLGEVRRDGVLLRQHITDKGCARVTIGWKSTAPAGQ